MSLVNPVSAFYEFYLAITQYALPAPFMAFFGMSIACFVVLCLYQLFWSIK